MAGKNSTYPDERMAMRMGGLVLKQLNGTLSDADAAELAQWLASSTAYRQVYDEMMDESHRGSALAQRSPQDPDVVLKRVLERHERLHPDPVADGKSARRGRLLVKRPVWRWAAAVAVTILTVGLFYWSSDFGDTDQPFATTEILPGGNRAVLRLTDGRVMELSRAQEGIVVGESGVRYSDGSLVWNKPRLSDVAGPRDGQIMSVSTPNGGTYQITLPDGSRVWLNAGSTLRYPAIFDGDERTVELEGEAYFEIVRQNTISQRTIKERSKSFRVKTSDQTIEVLGTRFNISAYPDEAETKTTLISGSVSVSVPGTRVSQLLKPGEQSISLDDTFTKREVDTDLVMAWKNGYFHFSGKTLEAAMKEVARWYDISVRYEQDSHRRQRLAGTISKYDSIHAVLETMALSGAIRYRWEGRTLIIE